MYKILTYSCIFTCRISLLIIFIGIAQVATGQDFHLFERETYTSNKKGALPYRILYPDGYTKEKEYPLVIFLHGAGERGNDNQKQLTHGADLFLEPKNREGFPAIVVFPQCPEDKYWVDINIRKKLYAKETLDFEEVKKRPTNEMKLVLGLTKQLIKQENVNKDMVYVMGLSMGGLGTFEMVTRWPRLFTAAVPICGGGNPDKTNRYANKVSLWITHGAQDDIIPVEYSRSVYHALVAHKADVRYTEFPDVEHNAWDPTFEISELLPWLFSKSKK